MRFKVILFTLGSLLFSFNLQAKLGVGVGFAQGQSPYRSVSSNPNILPAYINYQGDKGYFRGIEGGLHLWKKGERGKRFTVSAIGSLRMEGYKASDSYYLQGMEKRQWSLDMGLGSALQLGYNRFSARVVTDTLGRHKGYSAGVGYARIIPMSKKFMLVPSTHVTWQSNQLLDYYFGVTKNEANAFLDRPAFEAKGGVQLRASLLASYTINPKTSLMLVATTRRLPNSITDSPLVDKKQVSTVFGAINFSF
ncbi:MipA/OmpV family protein [Marinospirillum insulare]|uniref:MltA-interacting protein MipA n=1 Tax=Marinospirillum insulare TaxID=217169 RepID=A0ABQ5ZYA4_9GAMM|nr:MipA/OmpV family protein [Marinospirillum insulare]GLR62973.1 MltA-interacting protein MipA [Marinospirillum insulare]